MKKIIILLLICFVYIRCSAQRLTPGEIKGRHETFVVYELQPSLMMDTIKRIGIDSKNNKYNNGIPRPKEKHVFPVNQNADVHINKNAVRQIIYHILSKKVNALNHNKETMDVDFVFRPNGELSDIGYTLHESTLITLPDIEAIDQQLRATIKATFTGRAYLQYEAIYYPVLPPIVF